MLAMNYSEIIPVLIRAIQEQDDTIQKQQAQLASQEKALAEIYELLKPEARPAP